MASFSARSEVNTAKGRACLYVYLYIIHVRQTCGLFTLNRCKLRLAFKLSTQEGKWLTDSVSLIKYMQLIEATLIAFYQAFYPVFKINAQWNGVREDNFHIPTTSLYQLYTYTCTSTTGRKPQMYTNDITENRYMYDGTAIRHCIIYTEPLPQNIFTYRDSQYHLQIQTV